MSYSNRAIAPPDLEEAPSDNAGMREALAEITILPAPTNVDDLVARLDEEGVPYASGPLATIISDARVPDLEPTLLTVWEDNEMSDDTFFVSIPMANTNNPRPSRPLAPRMLGLLFASGLTIGTLLICWNALVSADLLPASPEAAVVEMSDAPGPAVAASTEPEQAATAYASLEAAGNANAPAQLAEAAPAAVPQPDPSREPVPVAETSPRGDTALAQLADMLAASAPVAMPEPAFMRAPQPIADAQTPTPQTAPLQVAEALAASAPVGLPEPVVTPKPEAVPASPEPLASPSPHAPVVTIAASEPVDAPPPIAAAPEPPAATTSAPADETVAETGATDSSPSAANHEPVSAGLPERAVERGPRRELASSEHMSMASHRASTAARLHARARPSARVSFAGVWAASAEACTPQMQREGHLLTYINARRARAGDTSCSFRKIRRKGNVWDIAAVCSDGETKWNSDVQLTSSRASLTWTSQKGTTTYVRCRRG